MNEQWNILELWSDTVLLRELHKRCPHYLSQVHSTYQVGLGKARLPFLLGILLTSSPSSLPCEELIELGRVDSPVTGTKDAQPVAASICIRDIQLHELLWDLRPHGSLFGLGWWPPACIRTLCSRPLPSPTSKHRLPSLRPRDPDSVGLGWDLTVCIPNKFPGAACAAGSGTHFENCWRICSLFSSVCVFGGFKGLISSWVWG